MHETEAEDIMSRMESGAAEDVQTLLAHEGETAGGAMETSCLEASPGQRAGEVLEGVRAVAKEAGVFNYVYVLDGRRHLLGVLNLRELFSAPPDAPIESLMAAHIVKVRPDTRLRDVGRAFAKYGFRAIPVVTEDNVFIGAVRLTHVLDKIWPMFRE
jgi:magnesium transporter